MYIQRGNKSRIFVRFSFVLNLIFVKLIVIVFGILNYDIVIRDLEKKEYYEKILLKKCYLYKKVNRIEIYIDLGILYRYVI